MIRVLLTDDQPLIRTGLRVLIADTPDIEVVGEAGDGAEAVALAGQLRPDVAVMDIRMPGMDGIEATRLITGAAGDGTRVLVLTTFDDDEYVYAALRAGASGFLLKDMRLETILDGIRVVAAGDGLIAPAVTRRLIEEFARRAPLAGAPARGPSRGGEADRSGRRREAGHGGPDEPDGQEGQDERLRGITDREREVLTLVGRGMSNTEIAQTLFISVATAKSHVARLFSKLGARDRVQLVIISYETGLVG
ncbi:response regulator transcription factor [Streptomyces sp. NBC_00448]|uniref:response regulator transcription factor n=1 Tax=Streptomyces sp. NBC_00448 TaxID=2903652 RepID=UPI002E1E4A49